MDSDGVPSGRSRIVSLLLEFLHPDLRGFVRPFWSSVVTAFPTPQFLLAALSDVSAPVALEGFRRIDRREDFRSEARRRGESSATAGRVSAVSLHRQA